MNVTLNVTGPDGSVVAAVTYSRTEFDTRSLGHDVAGALRGVVGAALDEAVIPIVVKFMWDAKPVGYLDIEVRGLLAGKWLCFWHDGGDWTIHNRTDKEFRFNAMWAEVPEEHRPLSWEPWARCPIFGPVIVPPGKLTRITWENAPIFKLRKS